MVWLWLAYSLTTTVWLHLAYTFTIGLWFDYDWPMVWLRLADSHLVRGLSCLLFPLSPQSSLWHIILHYTFISSIVKKSFLLQSWFWFWCFRAPIRYSLYHYSLIPRLQPATQLKCIHFLPISEVTRPPLVSPLVTCLTLHSLLRLHSSQLFRTLSRSPSSVKNR